MSSSNMICPNCSVRLLLNHLLDSSDVAPARNKSRILHPMCSVCGYVIQLSDVSAHIKSDRKVLLITGTCGAGKTSLGQLIEKRSDCIFIDGDSVTRRVNHYIRQNSDAKAELVTDSTPQIIETMMMLCGLGYNVVVGYIINNCEKLAMYQIPLGNYGISSIFRVLVPQRSVCIQRDIARDCWTAGEEWVDAFYDEMHDFLVSHPLSCLDTSDESLEETFAKHFAELF